jgi:hypothetical protein
VHLRKQKQQFPSIGTTVRTDIKSSCNEVEPDAAMEICGHKTKEVFDRYNIVDLEGQKIAAMKRSEKA